jgi:hypothetical protein
MRAALFLFVPLCFLAPLSGSVYAAQPVQRKQSVRHIPGQAAAKASRALHKMPVRSAARKTVPESSVQNRARVQDRRSIGPAKAVVQPLNQQRHLSPNPPLVAGLANAVKRNTGSIDGRQVHRRP